MNTAASEAFSFSLSEFVWILFFLALGAFSLLYTDYRTVQQENVRLMEENASLIADNMILKARIEELEGGVIPCWKRPDSPIPELVGTIIIDSPRLIRVIPDNGSEKSILLSPDSPHQGFLVLKETLIDQYKTLRGFAARNNCYLRMEVINHTERYSLYQEAAAVLKSLNIVVVQG